ncbi:MAG: hypothetical protein GXY48_05280 [Methanomicrobiales archaeon]|nr:hypothetical protein [Methanomicrobiales archaeon]
MPSQLLDILSYVFYKKNQDYINLSELKIGKTAIQLSDTLKINIKNHSNGELMNIIKPMLPSNYIFGKKGRSIYLFRKPPQDIIYDYTLKHSTLTLNRIASILPFTKEEFTLSVNTLIQNGQIKISIISQSKGFGCKIIPISYKKLTDEKEELKKAYDSLLKGKSYVKIFELRRYVNWSKEQFDSTIQKLWDDKVIELQESNPALLNDDEKKDSYRDKNNGLRILLIWRK